MTYRNAICVMRVFMLTIRSEITYFSYQVIYKATSLFLNSNFAQIIGVHRLHAFTVNVSRVGKDIRYLNSDNCNITTGKLFQSSKIWTLHLLHEESVARTSPPRSPLPRLEQRVSTFTMKLTISQACLLVCKLYLMLANQNAAQACPSAVNLIAGFDVVSLG